MGFAIKVMTPSEFRQRTQDKKTFEARDVTVHEPIILHSVAVAERIELDRFIFEELVDFEDCRFAMLVRFENCVFRKGLVLRHAQFRGPLTLYDCQICGTNSPASFENLRVEGQLDLTRFCVHSDLRMTDLFCGAAVLLNGATIGGDVSAASACVKGELKLGASNASPNDDLKGAARISGRLNLSQSSIGSQMAFTGAEIGAVDLEQSKIGGTIFCHSCHFTREGPRDLSEAPFLGSLSLFGATVNGNIELKNAVLKSGLNLSSAEIRGNLIVENSTLGKTSTSSLRMADARIRGTAQFAEASFDGPLVASNASVGVLELDGSTLVNLEEQGDILKKDKIEKSAGANPEIKDLNLELLDFTGIVFSDLNFRKMRSRTLRPPEQSSLTTWAKLRGQVVQLGKRMFCRTHCDILKQSPYVRLLELSRLDERIYANVESLLRRRGNDSEADSVFLRLRSRELPSLDRKLRKGLNWFLLHSCGFGLVIRWFAAAALLMLFLNCLFFGFGRLDNLQRTPLAPAVAVSQPTPKAQPGRWDAFWTVFRIEIPLLSASTPKEWEPSRNYKTWAGISTVLNWLVIPLVVASLSGLWKRRIR